MSWLTMEKHFTLTATVTAGTTTNASAAGTGTISDEPTADTALVSLVGPATVVEGSGDDELHGQC